MLGLVYTGTREEGSSVMLYRSYKTVDVTKRKPYRFTDKDITTPEALNYYSRIGSKLNIRLSNDENDFSKVRKSNIKPEVRKEPLAAETDVQLDVQSKNNALDINVDNSTKEYNEDIDKIGYEVAGASTDSNEQVGLSNITDKQEEEPVVATTEAVIDKELVAQMNENELSEYLDLNFTDDGITDLAKKVGIKRVGSKNKSRLISEIIASKEELLK